jgi:hypothetical protein
MTVEQNARQLFSASASVVNQGEPMLLAEQ